MRVALLVLAGCAELGVVGDGTSISVGPAFGGHLIDGARLPASGEGFMTREVWISRNARYGTDELVELITGVARRMHAKASDARLVVGDLSTRGGGGGEAFHRSHQNGRDADLCLFMRKDGKPFEADTMHPFDKDLHVKDGSGLTIDIPRQWLLVKELITAPEANVQWLFLYEPIAKAVLAHAKDIGEPDELIARARRALLQPTGARHDDHMHVRVYCTDADKQYGCKDAGQLELRDSERATAASALPEDLLKGRRLPLD